MLIVLLTRPASTQGPDPYLDHQKALAGPALCPAHRPLPPALHLQPAPPAPPGRARPHSPPARADESTRRACGRGESAARLAHCWGGARGGFSINIPECKPSLKFAQETLHVGLREVSDKESFSLALTAGTFLRRERQTWGRHRVRPCRVPRRVCCLSVPRDVGQDLALSCPSAAPSGTANNGLCSALRDQGPREED